MKLLVAAAVVLCVSQCQALGYHRRQMAPASLLKNSFPTPSPNMENRNNDLNLIHHQTNVLTGRLILQVSDLMAFVVFKLHQFKKLFDGFGWTNLSIWMGNLIDYLNQHQEEPNSDQGNYNRDQFRRYPEEQLPCQPMDHRPECHVF